mmetsp:Transcript_8023/g.17371  ORF Transcript_8023/g.17371 Transcript_8023/m.17371 type:complete len:369 (+) Transcript_8023:755-1861(+)
MKRSFCSTSAAAAFTSPMVTRNGSVRMEPASSTTAGGIVAENMHVCSKLRPPSTRGQCSRISSTWGAKPRSNNLSASSRTKCRVASSDILSSRRSCASRSGVVTATSSLLMVWALSFDSLSKTRPPHFRPTVSFPNSSSVCLASSRVGSTMTTRANSLPGLPRRASNGPRNAMVFPLPVGAEASTWLPARMAGKHCICTAVGLAKPRPWRFRTSHWGTPAAAIASKVSQGSGAPAETWMRFRRRKALTSSGRRGATTTAVDAADADAVDAAEPSFLLALRGAPGEPLSAPRGLLPEAPLAPLPVPPPPKKSREVEAGSAVLACGTFAKTTSLDFGAPPKLQPFRSTSKKSIAPPRATHGPQGSRASLT